jgi:inorganic pyrophosphatase
VDHIRSIADMDQGLKGLIETFVRTYKQNQGVEVSFDGWLDRDDALDRLRRDFKAAKKHPAK